MKLHYMGKYNLDPDSLPHGEHKEGAVKFREAGDTAELGRIVSKVSLSLLAVLMTALLYRYRSIPSEQWLIGLLLFLASLFPHELLHAVCFRGDVYLYTNLVQGMLFVVGPEGMSKARLVFMCSVRRCDGSARPRLARHIRHDLADGRRRRLLQRQKRPDPNAQRCPLLFI